MIYKELLPGTGDALFLGMANKNLTQAQARLLLSKHATGDFCGMVNRAKVLDSLIAKGMIEERDRAYVLTPQAAEWCLENHANYSGWL